MRAAYACATLAEQEDDTMRRMMPYRFYRFPRRSILDGVARLWDFSGAIHTYRPLSATEALASDWRVVGDVLAEAMGLFSEETGYVPEGRDDSRLESGAKSS